MQRIPYNIKFGPKTSEEIEEFRQKKQDEEGQPVSKTATIDFLVKKGLEVVRNEK